MGKNYFLFSQSPDIIGGGRKVVEREWFAEFKSLGMRKEGYTSSDCNIKIK